MNSLNSILEARTALFSHISVPRRSAPRTCSPLIPNKIHFIVKPERFQVLSSGLYFEIPELSFNEMDVLEKAILHAIKLNPLKLRYSLNIPPELAFKLGPSSCSLFNGFVLKGSKVYLESANCIFVPSFLNPPTDTFNPVYGTKVGLMEAAVCLSFLATASSIDRCGFFETRLPMLTRTWAKLVNEVKPYRLKRSTLRNTVLTIGDVQFSDYATSDGLSGEVVDVLSRFLLLETDLSKSLEW